MLIFKYLPRNIFVVFSLVLGLVGLIGLSWTAAAAALTPADLIVVFNLNVPGNLKRVVLGERVGSLVGS